MSDSVMPTANTDDAVSVNRWDYPAVDDSIIQELKGVHDRGAHLLTAGQVDALQKQAHEEAYARGLEEGLAAGATELATRVERLDRLTGSLARPLADIDQLLQRELLELATVLAEQVLHRELETDPTLILSFVKDCLDALPSYARDVTLHLCPLDAGLVAEHWAGDPYRPWRIAEDSTLDRGSLRVSSDSAQIDGSVRSRLREIVDAALSNRSADRP